MSAGSQKRSASRLRYRLRREWNNYVPRRVEDPPSTITVLDAGGNPHTVPLAGLDADGNTVTISNDGLDADGNPVTVP